MKETVDQGQVLMSGSRDGTVRFWQQQQPDQQQQQQQQQQWFCSGVFTGHVGQVSCLTRLKNLQAFAPNLALSFTHGLVVSGGVDKIINLYEPILAGFDESTVVSEAVFSLAGHTDTVCSLSVDEEIIVSGSWDK